MEYICLYELSYNHDLTMSICIPCIPKHIPHLNALMTSINNQTVIPNEIIVFISEYSVEQCDKLRDFFKMTYSSLNIILGCCDAKQYAGPNRNCAIALSTGDIISLMDADDIMHPRRTEYIFKVFSNFDIKGLLHHYVQNTDFQLEVDDDTIPKKLLFSYQFNDFIQHGHPSFTRDVFMTPIIKLNYIDDKVVEEKGEIVNMLYGEEPRTQDFLFIMEFVKKYPNKMAVLCVNLSKYRAELSSLYSIR